MLQRRLDACVSGFAPKRFFNIGGPDSLNVFFPSPLCGYGKHQFCFFVQLVFEASLKEVNVNVCMSLVVVLQNWNKLFSQGWAKWTAAQAASHFLVLFFPCLGALTCDNRFRNLSANSLKRLRKGAPVLAYFEPNPVVGLAPASHGGDCVRFSRTHLCKRSAAGRCDEPFGVQGSWPHGCPRPSSFGTQRSQFPRESQSNVQRFFQELQTHGCKQRREISSTSVPRLVGIRPRCVGMVNATFHLQHQRYSSGASGARGLFHTNSLQDSSPVSYTHLTLPTTPYV